MNEKLNHLLQEMQEVKRNDAEKEETWRKLQGRLQKKTRSNHWQYRTVFTVVLAMLVLIMTMLITESNYSNKNATLPLSNAIRTVHFYETDTPNQFNGKDSRLYFGVEKLTSTAYQQLEKLLALQQNTQLPANVVKDLDSEAYDLVITFQDGHQQRLKWYHYAATDGELLMLDWDTKVFHMIPEATALEVREEIWQLQKDFSHISIKGPIILIVAVLLNALLTRLILKKYKLPKKPELFPQKKWVAVDIIWVTLLFILGMLHLFKFAQPLFIGCITPGVIMICYWQYWINRKLTPQSGYLLLRYLYVAYIFVILFYMLS
ncbi:hypothetical protein [Lysinibacillus sphaericus]|uniref:Uncharacterized protein n=1 Tax=Lysinibacillus sphaericus OT4b.31 TaxID=1285586 RepID=R7ZC94_LYSSH|nr:hypothetical protein [Lysinibacillus sphaericus]EON71723.1 hypothetical protein H131_14608 [Lysinibacillus sphaericus OT4b.31]